MPPVRICVGLNEEMVTAFDRWLLLCLDHGSNNQVYYFDYLGKQGQIIGAQDGLEEQG